jgi:NAD(P)-dependent dehydrogenase (short-subunit alcohol dehydrogenase family)
MIINELALALWQHRIRVNGIAPGYVAEKETLHPWGEKYRRAVRPEHVGRTAVFLASNYFSEYTTGSVIKVDAGLSLHNFLVDLYREDA